MEEHDVILGLSWLRQHNPEIDFVTEQFDFSRCLCTQLQQTIVEASKRQYDNITKKQINAIRRKTLHKVMIAYIRKINEPGAQKLPPEYSMFARLFDKQEASKLPDHKPWDHRIPIQEGKTPTFGPIYSLSEREREALRDYIQENLDKGFIRESTSPAGYPILFVPKKNGKLRLCVDYRKLNDITIKNRYPLPRIDQILQQVQGAVRMTKFDLQGAYNLIRMAEGEEWKTAFRTHYGLYKYCVMPFGLTNAPASF
jgi:hypothetical protein